MDNVNTGAVRPLDMNNIVLILVLMDNVNTARTAHLRRHHREVLILVLMDNVNTQSWLWLDDSFYLVLILVLMDNVNTACAAT